MTAVERWFVHLNAPRRAAYSVVAGAATFFAVHPHAQPATQWICAWNVFAGCLLVLAWGTILWTPQPEMRRIAKAQDASSTVIFCAVILAGCAAFLAVGYLFASNKGAHQPRLLGHLLLSLFAVVFAWCLVHTVFSLRYAHTFYGDKPDDVHAHFAGLDFPGEKHPNYIDFAYFSFVIGMTFQVSDVQVTQRRLRRLVLLHGVISFAFNTVILALTINTLSTLI
ncbi:MAG: DUF1345 domain-containing protein [Chthoniobacterales bacterium]